MITRLTFEPHARAIAVAATLEMMRARLDRPSPILSLLFLLWSKIISELAGQISSESAADSGQSSS